MRGKRRSRRQKKVRGLVPELRNFGARLVKLRKARGWTQEEVARKLYVSPQAVSKWENESSYPEITLLPRIANIFNVGVEHLFGSAENGFEFPNSCEGLNLAYSRGNAAVYSDKQYVSAEDGVVRFSDGSQVDLGTLTVKHVGGGRIELRFADEDFDWEEEDDWDDDDDDDCDEDEDDEDEDDEDQDQDSREYSFTQKFRGLAVYADYSGSYRISLSGGDITTVRAEGDRHAFESFRAEDENGVLTCRVKNRRAGDVNLDVEIKMARGWYESLTLNITGAVDIDCDMPFREAAFAISGSGDINMNEDIGEASVKISGSGDICLRSVNGPLTVKISGSGDVSCDKANGADVQISGSGDIKIGKIENSFKADISGSGDVDIKSGEVESFEVTIGGCGEVKAENVTAQNADIFVESDGEVTLGRVVRESKVRAGKDAEVRILKRG